VLFPPTFEYRLISALTCQEENIHTKVNNGVEYNEIADLVPDLWVWNESRKQEVQVAVKN
jgi:hypothetical protein